MVVTTSLAVKAKTVMSLPAKPAKPAHQAGFTLLEMMVALAIGAVFAAGIASLSRVMSPRVEFRADIERIAADFEQARMMARREGRAIIVLLADSHYEIEALEIEGSLEGFNVETRGFGSELILQPNGFSDATRTLILSRDDFQAHVRIGAVSGRVQMQINEG